MDVFIALVVKLLICIAFVDIYSIQGQSLRVRLVSRDGSASSSLTEGRLELYYNTTWTTVCSSGFDNNIAGLACKKLGFLYPRGFGNVSSLGFISGAEDVATRQIICPTDASQITDCTYDNVLCSHVSDVALSCSNTDQITDNGVVRLVTRTGRTTNISSGRLEVFVNGEWGTVCDDFFDIIDSIVTCSQLGFPRPSTNGNVQNLRFSPANSSTPIWLHALRCSSTDTNILECPSGAREDLDCDHDEDVAVSCFGHGVLRLLLVNDKAPQSFGRLEIYLDGKWGTINSTGFTDSAADVACRQLGFTSAVNYGNVSSLGFSEGIKYLPVWLSSVDCSSNNEAIELLLDCSVNLSETISATYDHSDDLGLICLNPIIPGPTTSPPADVGVGVIIGSVIGSILFLILILTGSLILILIIRKLLSARDDQVKPHHTSTFSAATETVHIDDKVSSPPDQHAGSHNQGGEIEDDESNMPPPGTDNPPHPDLVDPEPFGSDQQPLV